MDKKDREQNLIPLGVPEEGECLEGITEDDDKVKKVWEVINSSSKILSVRRLGQRNFAGGSRRSRPILVTVESKGHRDEVAYWIKQRR